ncbi:hypothetical protein [Candidatus Sororendozoicomonas aggregata]|uniref:hypothetical protein n=1 Tax=Candidatus Sororendozoicomonas aggregata TaxID=3073239 RepID=UPI002ED3D412
MLLHLILNFAIVASTHYGKVDKAPPTLERYVVTKRQCLEDLLEMTEKALMEGMSDAEVNDYVNPN